MRENAAPRAGIINISSIKVFACVCSSLYGLILSISGTSWPHLLFVLCTQCIHCAELAGVSRHGSKRQKAAFSAC